MIRATSLLSVLFLFLVAVVEKKAMAFSFVGQRKAMTTSSSLWKRRQRQQHAPSTTIFDSSSLTVPPLHVASSSSSSAASIGTTGAGVVGEEETVNGLFGRPAQGQLSKWQSNLVRLGMIAFIASMCIALPATLLPQRLLYKMGLLSKTRKEKLALETGRQCAKWLLRLFPFCKMQCIPCDDDEHPRPSVWVCNHTSMLDIFLLLATDRKLRGQHMRPIKIIYWEGLEENPVTAMLFRQSGFIPVKMSDNGHGNQNEYDVSSFKRLLKDSKAAFEEGFDIGILPEGQLNPSTENGLLPVFPGAFTLAKMSRRPIRFMALYGIDRLWHPTKGMVCSDRTVKLRCYPGGSNFAGPDDFVDAFTKVVGHFGKYGADLPEAELKGLLAGHGK